MCLSTIVGSYESDSSHPTTRATPSHAPANRQLQECSAVRCSCPLKRVNIPARSNAVLGVRSLEIFRPETSVLGNSSKHLWANFLSVVKCEDEIGPPLTAKRAM